MGYAHFFIVIWFTSIKPPLYVFILDVVVLLTQPNSSQTCGFNITIKEKERGPVTQLPMMAVGAELQLKRKRRRHKAVGKATLPVCKSKPKKHGAKTHKV
jgi:hypothetical protein